MSQALKISIVTVSYNSASTILDTLNSVSCQRYAHKEHIIVDGDSQDNSVQLIAQYRPKVTCWISEKDSGIYHAMNKGIQMATGDIVGFLNADDVFAHSKVLDHINAVFQDPKVQCCFSDLVYVKTPKAEKYKRYWRGSPFKPGLFAKGWSPAHPTFYARRHLYQKWGGFDVSMPMGNDIELMMRFLEKHHAHSIYYPDLWVKMRIGGVSNQSVKHVYIQNKAILNALRRLDIAHHPLGFFWGKAVNRVGQILKRMPYDA